MPRVLAALVPLGLLTVNTRTNVL